MLTGTRLLLKDGMSGHENPNTRPQAFEELFTDSPAPTQFEAEPENDQDGRLRLLRSYLYTTDSNRVPIEELVAAVEEFETERPETDERPIRQSIRTSIVHEYLPRLASEGLLDYDPRRGEVRFHG